MEIDEATRFRVDYVRLKIACRDVTKVPKSAEGVLGLAVYDFGFEREISAADGEKLLKSGIKASDDQPPNKKQKPDVVPSNANVPSNVNTESFSKTPQGKSQGKQVMLSAPPKFQHVQAGGGNPKVMKDAQKAYSLPTHKDEEKVYIPESIEESESESDSFGERLRKLNEGQPSKCKDDSENQEEGSEQVWFMKEIPIEITIEKPMDLSVNELSNKEAENTQLTKNSSSDGISDSPELFLTDDNIIHTQGSQNEDLQMAVINPQVDDDMMALDSIDGSNNKMATVTAMNNPGVLTQNVVKKTVEKEFHLPPKERRQSERLKKEINLTTKEKNERMARKRNLEGLQKGLDQELLTKGAEDMLEIAVQLLCQKQPASGVAAQGSGHDDGDDEQN